MLFDQRLLGGNSTRELQTAWADDQLPRLQLLWSYMILLDFARLVRLDPMVVHTLSKLLDFVVNAGTLVVEETTWQIQ